MNRIIMLALIAGLTGCQGAPSLTANKLSGLSNEDLCRALSTYNNDGESVLKIYDELKKRPEQIDPEKCYILERINKEQQAEFKENDTRINRLYTDDINTTPSYSNNDFYQYTDLQHHKIIYHPRKNKQVDTETLEKINSFNRMPTYKNEPCIRETCNFSTRKTVTDKIDIKEEEMGKIMRECLKKHISKSHANSDK